MSRFKPSISVLREIGWRLWHPISLRDGLNELDPEWRENAEDEYDTYLLRACGMLLNGCDVEQVALYLNRAAEDDLTINAGGLAAAQATATALKQYVEEARRG